MGESLYSLLGVGEDADPETIRRAYRERASDVHPDVSDAPDATRQFKRLTVARDTLVDEDERARYDRLGHEAYLRQHARAELFDLEKKRAAAEPRGAGASRSEQSHTGVERATDRIDGEWWRDRGGQSTGHAPDPDPAAAWARMDESTAVRRDATVRRRVTRVGSEAGGWLLFHALLLSSAGTTGWVFYRSLPSQFAIAGLFATVGLLVAAVAATVLHLVSIVYT